MVTLAKPKLSDLQKQEVIMKLVNGATYAELAKEYSVSSTTIFNIKKNNPDYEKSVIHKKEENSKSILDHMDEIKGDVCNLLDTMLECMKDKARLEKATLSQIATAFGIIVDKFTQREQPTPDSTAANNLLEALSGVNVSKGAFDEVSEIQ